MCAARDEHGRLSLPRWPGLIVFADRRTLEAARAGQTGRPAGEEARRLAGVRPQRRRTCLGSGWRAHASTARQTHSSTRTTDDGRGAQNRSSSLLRRFSHSPRRLPRPSFILPYMVSYLCHMIDSDRLSAGTRVAVLCSSTTGLVQSGSLRAPKRTSHGSTVSRAAHRAQAPDIRLLPHAASACLTAAPAQQRPHPAPPRLPADHRRGRNPLQTLRLSTHRASDQRFYSLCRAAVRRADRVGGRRQRRPCLPVRGREPGK